MIELIITIAVVGVLVWLITAYVPMPESFKKVIMIIALLGVIIFSLKTFGLWH